MSKLIKCKTCNKEVSSEAKKCPHCGEQLKLGEFQGSIVGIAIVVIIAVLIIAGIDVLNGGDGKITINEMQRALK